jgi:hypothetical protein
MLREIMAGARFAVAAATVIPSADDLLVAKVAFVLKTAVTWCAPVFSEAVLNVVAPALRDAVPRTTPAS